MESITVTMSPEHVRTRLQVSAGERPILRAILGPAQEADPRAAAMLLEGLALWSQACPFVVVCVARGEESSGALELCDALEVGRKRLFFDVGVAVLDRHALSRRYSSVGEFRDLSRLSRRTFR
jgi:hypothetical protein